MNTLFNFGNKPLHREQSSICGNADSGTVCLAIQWAAQCALLLYEETCFGSNPLDEVGGLGVDSWEASLYVPGAVSRPDERVLKLAVYPG
jgi:hypothetical protein